MHPLPLTLTQLKSLTHHQTIVFLLTFLSYTSFHASRKPLSIIKSTLGPPPTPPPHSPTGWPPFNDPISGNHRLGELDLSFLLSYAFGMYFAGHVGDRVDVRLFLVWGMVASGVCGVLFGVGYWVGIHELGYYIGVMVASGLFQSVGWPCVVAVVGKWFGKGRRGLIMGVWNGHTSVGNIVGSVVASSVLEFGWGWSFVLPGGFIVLVGGLVFLFLVVSPEEVGLEIVEKEVEMVDGVVKLETIVEEEEEEDVGLLGVEEEGGREEEGAIGFLEAWRLPGVAPYAFCLFFSKLVAYTFLYWLPFYIRHTAVAGVHLSHKAAGMLSTVFDIGGVLGGISAGYISDKIEARAVTSIAFLFLSIPALIFYRVYGSISMYTNIGLMFLAGLFVNAPYALITTAVAADLGSQNSAKGNSRALATVTAIIDGTGSVGAALGPLLTGYISTAGWNGVFAMLIGAIFLAGLFLIQLAKAEIVSKMSQRRWFWHN